MSVRRKQEHLDVSLNCDVAARREEGWRDIQLLHECLPEIDRADIDHSVEFLGRRFDHPLVISALTGGCPEAAGINEALARAAARFNVGMELGSQSVLLRSAAMEYTYSIAREVAPTAFLVANIGASSLIAQPGRARCTLDQVMRLLDTIRADALAVHLNFLQESVMPEGDSRARGCLSAIEEVVRGLDVPVVVKETGAGISRAQAERLRDIGVAALEVGGAGGTSMALVESQRARRNNDPAHEALGSTFAHWGIPTAVSLVEARGSGLPLVASGGITNGLEAAKALALGATLVGVARPLHIAAARGPEAVVEWLELFFEELSVAMFLSAAATVPALRQRKTLVLGRTREWLEQLGHDVVNV